MTPEPITYPAPPPRLIEHMIAYLNRRIAKGDKPPAEWMQWLTGLQRAMRDSETVQIEILSQTDIDKFIALEW